MKNAPAIQPKQNVVTVLPSGAVISNKRLDSYRADGWQNILTGLGMGNDKRSYGSLVYRRLVEIDVETLYAGDDISARVIDLLPDHGIRKWIDLQGFDEKKELAIQEKLSAIEAKKKVLQALKWARMYGGAGLLIGTDEMEDLTKPLEPDTVENVLSLTLITRYELYPSQLQYDPMKPNFGYPEYYRLQLRGASPVNGHEVHHSRIIRFDGVELPRRLHIQNQYWGDSVLSRMYEIIRNFNTTHNSVATVMQDFRVGIFKLKNLAEMVAMGEDGLIQKRIALVDAAKSVARSVIIDSDNEDFEQATGQLSGVKDMLDAVNERLTTATGIPATVLFGRSPVGLGGSGRHEENNWLDHVTAYQEDSCRPPLKRLLEVVLQSRQGPTGGEMPEGWGFTFNPLQQQDPKEEAETRYTQAQADQIYMQNGAVTPEEIAISRFGGEKWDHNTKIDLSLRREVEGQTAQHENNEGPQGTEPENPDQQVNPRKPLLESPVHIPEVELNYSGQVDPDSGPIATLTAREPNDDHSDEVGFQKEPKDDPELNYNPNKYNNSTTSPGGEALPRQSYRSFSPSGKLLNAQNDAENRVSTVAVTKDGKLLMGRRRDNQKWTTPGGHLAPGEHPMAGALRELDEETGMALREADLKHLKSSAVKTKTGKTYDIHAFHAPLKGELPARLNADPDQEIEEWQWVPYEKGLPKEIASNLHSPKNVLLQALGIQKRPKLKRKDHDSSLIVKGKLNPENDPRDFAPTEMYFNRTSSKKPVVTKSKISYEPERDYFYQQEIPAPLASDIAVPPGTSTVSPSEPLTKLPADAPQITKVRTTTAPVEDEYDDNDATRPAQTIIVSKTISKTASQARKIASEFARGQELQAADETGTSFRFRLREPGDFVAGTMKTFKPPAKQGVSIVFGQLKGK